MVVLAGVALLLSLLPAHAAGQLVYADAKCSPGFEWLFTSVNQSPCDVAVELGGVCVAGQFNITQLAVGNAYFGPSVEIANNCRCSSVYYSMLSACAYCQQGNYIRWSVYNKNCSTTSLGSFGSPIPLGVKVPRWAYQDVSISDIFDVNVANSTDKSEGPPPTTTGGTSSSSTSSSGYKTGKSESKIAVIAAIVGGFVGLVLIGGIIAFCLIRRRRQASKSATKLEPISTDFNHVPEITRPTIPGFSHPGTPFVHSGALHSTPHYHVPNTANASPQTGYPMSVGGTSELHETTSALFSHTGERYHDLQNSSFTTPVNTDLYHNPQVSVSTAPVTDNYWTQTSSPSVTYSHPASERFYDSPLLSSLHTHQTGDSRFDQRSVTTRRQSHQSSVLSSPQTNHGTTLTSTASSRVNLLPNLLPPAYADVVDGNGRPPPQPEKQTLSPF